MLSRTSTPTLGVVTAADVTPPVRDSVMGIAHVTQLEVLAVGDRVTGGSDGRLLSKGEALLVVALAVHNCDTLRDTAVDGAALINCDRCGVNGDDADRRLGDAVAT